MGESRFNWENKLGFLFKASVALSAVPLLIAAFALITWRVKDFYEAFIVALLCAYMLWRFYLKTKKTVERKAREQEEEAQNNEGNTI